LYGRRYALGRSPDGSRGGFEPPADRAEALTELLKVATRSGTHRQVVVIPNPGDPESFAREAFVGTLGTPPSLRRPTFQGVATAFKIEETLA